MELSLKFVPDPVLRQACTPVARVDKATVELANKMIGLMYESQGIGLAASQVGILKQICVIDVSEDHTEKLILINPVIKNAEGSIKSEEGCLSMPGFRSTIMRAAELTVEYLDLDGEPRLLEANDLLSRCIQHELDHLQGVLFSDHLTGVKKRLFESWLKKQ